MLTHVNYRSGAMHDMAALTRAAHAAGALVLWDLSHSVGAVPLQLAADEVDFAVGCGYKYTQRWARRAGVSARREAAAGRSAVAADRLAWPCRTVRVRAQLSAGERDCPHGGRDAADPVARRIGGGDRYRTGGADAGWCVRSRCGWPRCSSRLMERESEFGLLTPREPAARGSQVAFAHPDGYAIMQALIERGVIGDFRAPDVLRFGLAPLYVRYVDVWDAVAMLRDVMRSEAWRDARFQQTAKRDVGSLDAGMQADPPPPPAGRRGSLCPIRSSPCSPTPRRDAGDRLRSSRRLVPTGIA